MLHNLREVVGPPETMSAVDMETEPPRQRGRRLKVHRWRQIKPVLSGRYLIKGAVPASGISALFGHSGCGKSFLVVDLALHIALGWDWFERRTCQAGVVYVAAEGGLALQNRIEAFRLHHSLDLADVPFVLIPETVDLFEKDVGLLLETIREESAALAVPVGLVVIDTVSKTLGAGKENTDDLAGYIANCERMAGDLGAHVLLVHHRPKDSENRSLRGHSSFGAGVDASLLVEADGNSRSAECVKMKDGPDGWRIGFELKSIDLGKDDDGDDVTSCVVLPMDAPANRRGRVKLVDVQRVALAALRERIAPAGSVGDRAMFGRTVPRADLRAIWIAAGAMDEETRRAKVGEVLAALVSKGLAHVQGEQVTVTEAGWAVSL
ncbi:MAG: AAA family ATPase [Sphingomonadaceae bacterium]|nr:AAA family ATPase [Sphingomonadaceae bacterium]